MFTSQRGVDRWTSQYLLTPLPSYWAEKNLSEQHYCAWCAPQVFPSTCELFFKQLHVYALENRTQNLPRNVWPLFILNRHFGNGKKKVLQFTANKPGERSACTLWAGWKHPSGFSSHQYKYPPLWTPMTDVWLIYHVNFIWEVVVLFKLY